jgi:hypothetical protein
MTATDCAWVVLIALAALAVRAAPRLALPHALDSDSYFHLCCARAIRGNRLRLPERLPGVVLGHEYTYPFLYHWLLALLPERARLRAERISSALFDTAAVLVVAWFSFWLAETRAWDLDPRTPLVATALFALSPALLRIGSGPRAYSGSPRPLGELLYLLHVTCAYHALATGAPATAAVSVLSAAAIFAGSKFSAQALLFFAPAFAIFVSPWYLALVTVAAAAAIALSGGKAWRVMVGHYRHSDFYVRHLQRLFLHVGAPTWRGYAAGLLAHAREAVARRSARPFVDWYFREPHPLHLLVTVFTPFLVVPFAAAAESGTGPLRFLLAWSGIGFAWFVATRMRPLRFLGEGERYLEHALVPALVVAADFLLRSHPAWVAGYLVYSAGAAVAYVAAFRTRHAESEAGHAEAARAFAALGRMPPGVVLPIGSLHWRALYHAPFPVLTIGGNVDLSLLPLEEFMLVYGRYPYPSADFAGILERYGVRYIVSDPPHLRHYAEAILESSRTFHDRVRALFDSPRLVVYEVMPGR